MKKTIVNFILDKSGSMSSVASVTASGFDEYVGMLKKDKKSEYAMTLTTFDTEVHEVFKGESIKEIKDLLSYGYNPDGMTALYDAVCRTIKGVKAKKGEKVLFIIMTDGQENSSKEYTEVQMKVLIEEKEKEGWKFVYLGANQDSYATAQKFGISKMNVANFHATGIGVGVTMRAMAVNTVMYSASTGSDAFFSKQDQDNLENTK